MKRIFASLNTNDCVRYADKKLRIYRIISIVALSFMIIFMLSYASKQSFWYDELDWTIGIFAGKDFRSICETLLNSGYNLPLYYVILAPLYNILPYGEVWLLIPSIVFVIVGIVALSKAGQCIGGEDIGLFALCISVVSSILITQGGWELRPYSILFCFASSTLLYYAKRLKKETWTNIILYAASMLLMLYSHWFGAIIAVFYAFSDLFFWIEKKLSFKCMVSYIVAGLLYLPWLIFMFIRHTTDLSVYWAETPGITAPVMIIYYLLSNSKILLILFCVGCLIVIIKWLLALKNRQYVAGINLWVNMIVGMAWVICPIFVYSRYINPEGSIFVDRYFFVVIPQVFLITAYAISEIIIKIGITDGSLDVKNASWLNKISKPAIITVLLLFCCIGYKTYNNCILSAKISPEPYREVAEYLSQDEQIYSDGTLVLSSSNGINWVKYYFMKRGYSIPANYAVGKDDIILYVIGGEFSEKTILPTEQLLNYKTIYMFEDHENFKKDLVEYIGLHYSVKKCVAGINRFSLTIYSN